MGRVGVGLGLAVLAATIACSGGGSSQDDSFGPDPDFSTLDARLATPTGTLSAEGVARGERAIQAVRTPPVSVVALVHAAPSRTACPALAHGDAAGTCACPDGGAFQYDFAALADARAGGDTSGAVTVRVRLIHCAVGSSILDGREFAQVRAGQTTAVEAELELASDPSTSRIDVWRANGTWWARTPVADGAILVGLAANVDGDSPDAQTIIVKDRAATWTCDATTEKCTTGGENKTRGDNKT